MLKRNKPNTINIYSSETSFLKMKVLNQGRTRQITIISRYVDVDNDFGRVQLTAPELDTPPADHFNKQIKAQIIALIIPPVGGSPLHLK